MARNRAFGSRGISAPFFVLAGRGHVSSVSVRLMGETVQGPGQPPGRLLGSPCPRMGQPCTAAPRALGTAALAHSPLLHGLCMQQSVQEPVLVGAPR